MKKQGPVILIRLILVPAFLFLAYAMLPMDAFAQGRLSDPYSGNTLYAASPDSPPVEDDDFDFLEEEYETAVSAVNDPLEPWNRAMFRINDSLYFRVFKPVAIAYGRVIPKPARTGIKHFFHNIKAPIRIANCILQGKGKSAMAEYSGFIVNSTAGFLGFSDPAGNYPGLNPGEEDLGQTLGHYGIDNGIYLVWPIFGFSTLRDTVGMVGDTVFLNPVTYIEPMEVRIGITAEEKVNATSLIIGNYESLKDASITPYEAFRNAYIQHRNNLVNE